MKRTVHNALEAKTLIKEAIEMGDVDSINDVSWFTHSGDYIFTTKTPFINSIDKVLFLNLSVAETGSLEGINSV